jgi:hypothetical protein
MFQQGQRRRLLDGQGHRPEVCPRLLHLLQSPVS